MTALDTRCPNPSPNPYSMTGRRIRTIGRLRAGGGLYASLALDFTSGALDSRVTASGGAGGTRVNSSGNIVAATTPRFDYNPSTLAISGLLIEEQRTNLLLRSAEFDNASWTPNGVTVSANAANGPDGTLSADNVIPTAIAGTFKEPQQAFSVTSGTTYVFSQYFKQNGYQFVQLIGSGTEFGSLAINYDLSNGSETRFAAGTSTVVGRGIVDAGNGWWRCWVAATALATSAAGQLGSNIVPASNSVRGISWTGDGTSGILYFGAQLEAGSFPTSYIPTTTATVTRTADSLVMTGSNFSSWFNAANGTFFGWIGDGLQTSTTSPNPVFFSANDGTTSNRLACDLSATPAPRFIVLSGGSVIAQIAVVTTAPIKFAAAYAVNDFEQASNATLGTAVATGALPVGPVQFNIGSNQSGVNTMTGHLKVLKYYPTRLSNTQLQALTT